MNASIEKDEYFQIIIEEMPAVESLARFPRSLRDQILLAQLLRIQWVLGLEADAKTHYPLPKLLRRRDALTALGVGVRPIVGTSEPESKKTRIKTEGWRGISVGMEDPRSDNLDQLFDSIRRNIVRRPDLYEAIKNLVESETAVEVAPELLPTSLPDEAPCRWADRNPKTIDFMEWLQREDGWGPYFRAGLLTQKELGARDPSARVALFDYAYKHSLDPHGIIPGDRRMGDGAKARQLLLEGRESEARLLVSAGYMRRLKRELKAES